MINKTHDEILVGKFWSKWLTFKMCFEFEVSQNVWSEFEMVLSKIGSKLKFFENV